MYVLCNSKFLSKVLKTKTLNLWSKQRDQVNLVSYFNRKNRQSHYDSGKGPTIANKILARNQAKLNKRKM